MKTIIDSTRAGKLNWREISHYIGLFRYLSLRDVLVRYKQTWAGLLWAVMRPLIQIVIFGFLNLIIQRSASYADAFLFVASGVIIWQLVSTSITDISNSLVSNSNILTKVYFPKILLPASSLLVCLIDFAIAFTIFLVMFFILQGLPGLEILMLPFVLLYTMLFCFALGLMFATMNVKYRDIKLLLPFILQIAFYISPVFLSTDFYLERNVPEILKDIYLLNPLVSILDGFRFCFFGGEAIRSIPLFLGSVGVTVLILIFSIRYFLRFEKTFADYI